MNYTTARMSLLFVALLSGTNAWSMKRPSQEAYVFKKDSNQAEQAVRYQQANPKRYRCEYEQCQYSTSQRGYMLRHKELHDEQNNFKCDDCGYLTQDQSSLREHLVIHKKRSNYYCAIGTCNLIFKNMSSLKAHVQREHGSLRG